MKGYKWVKKSTAFESKLVGTVLVWNFSIPVVYKGERISKNYTSIYWFWR